MTPGHVWKVRPELTQSGKGKEPAVAACTFIQNSSANGRPFHQDILRFGSAVGFCRQSKGRREESQESQRRKTVGERNTLEKRKGFID